MSETFISVDIEASGPIPGRYSMLSIGSCLIGDPQDGFYVEIQPTSEDFVPEALEVSRLSMAQLRSTGKTPDQAMSMFTQWLVRFEKPIFVGFNAAFDWAFVNYYFITYGDGHNPFGFAPLDIKAFAMGLLQLTWDETRSSRLGKRLGIESPATHHALEDARGQARLFSAMQKMAL